MMDVERQDPGHWSFRLGPVEKWVVGAVAGGALAMAVYFVNSITMRLDKQGESLQTLAQAQAVTNSQLVTLNLQLADVPNLSRQMAEIKVRVDRHDEDLREVRATRGLR